MKRLISSILAVLLIFQNAPLDLQIKAGNKILKLSTLKTAEAAGEGWLSGYNYRKAIVVNNSGASALSDYQVQVTNPIYDETGLVGSWHLEEGTGTAVADSSGNGKNGTMNGVSYWTTAGKFGNGFNGSGTNYAGIGNIGTGIKTVEFWINDSNAADGILELINNATYISIAGSAITATGFTSPVIYVNGSSASAALSAGWNHVVVTTNTGIAANGVNIGEANNDYTAGIID